MVTPTKKPLPEGLRKEILEWFCGRVGDHLPNEHYQRLVPELEEMLGLKRL